MSVFCDRDGVIWVGTITHGVHRRHADRFEPFMAG